MRPQIILSAILFAVLINGPTILPSAHAQVKTPRKIKLRLLISLDTTTEFEQNLSTLIAQFNAEHTDANLEVIRRGTSFEVLRAIIAAHYAGDLPDMAILNEADLPAVRELGILRPISEKWFQSMQFRPQTLTHTKCANNWCSAPFQRRIPVWYFNREALFKVTDQTAHLPTQWGKLAELSTSIATAKAFVGQVAGIALPVSGEAALARWGALGLGPIQSPADTGADWVSKITKASNWTNSILPGRPTTDEATRKFLDGRAVILLGSLEQLTYIKKNANFKLGTDLPSDDLFWFGTDLVLLDRKSAAKDADVAAKRTSKRQDLCQNFLELVYKTSSRLAIFRSTPSLPVFKDELESNLFTNEPGSGDFVKMAMTRKIRALELDKIAPQTRQEWASQVWNAVEQHTDSATLRQSLQKLLSTNSR